MEVGQSLDAPVHAFYPMSRQGVDPCLVHHGGPCAEVPQKSSGCRDFQPPWVSKYSTKAIKEAVKKSSKTDKQCLGKKHPFKYSIQD